ncbi:uncharacterized protein BT62DRAFT_996020 [Guyanagaster necrorhizus]|uniref:Uncharacterized protein n=1 Tax=Guyanagaster necrorhizus TaxID=856835 RepID=A0A9P8APL2_9AGAR|nr:uncharacterized protein BT62DRAFT_996020 [Guyanagaster necrorhizus MCA 3950]KAG7443463.1 hypothetical protein BT62DRAFT_996020 [Guyanagaster necrorhizus MCA 3950]
MNPYGQVYCYPVTHGYDCNGNPIVYSVIPPQMRPVAVQAPSPIPSMSSSSSSATIVALPGAPKESPQMYFAKVCRLVYFVEQWQETNKYPVSDWVYPEYLVDPVTKEWVNVLEAFQIFGEEFKEEEKATWPIWGGQRRQFLDVVDDVLERLKGEREIAIQMMRGNLPD